MARTKASERKKIEQLVTHNRVSKPKRKKKNTNKIVIPNQQIQARLNAAEKQRKKDNRSHKGRKINLWDPKKMKEALKQYYEERLPIFEGKPLTYRQLGDKYGIAPSTIFHRVKGRHVEGHKHASGGKGRSKILPTDVERRFTDLICQYNLYGFPLTPEEIRVIAYDFAVDNDHKGFSSDAQRAGRDWLNGFMKRWDCLALKKPIDLSVNRALAINWTDVTIWFDKYKKVLQQLGITTPDRIFNVDEHGTEHHAKTRQVVGQKLSKSIQLQYGEKPKRSTMLTFVRGDGVAIPPMVIHKGKFNESWTRDRMPGAMVRSSQKGYINKKLFLEYGTRLIFHLASEEKLHLNHLLLMDSHYSHTFNHGFMELMRKHNITVMALEAHSSHLLQPLDKNPFSGFKQAFNKYLRKWNRTNGARPIRADEFFSVFNLAWQKAITPENIRAGFKRTGIWPVDQSKFPKELFTVGKPATGQIKAFEDRIVIPDVPEPLAEIESDSDEELEDRVPQPDLPDDVGERENEYEDDINNEFPLPHDSDSESDNDGAGADCEQEVEANDCPERDSNCQQEVEVEVHKCQHEVDVEVHNADVEKMLTIGLGDENSSQESQQSQSTNVISDSEPEDNSTKKRGRPKRRLMRDLPIEIPPAARKFKSFRLSQRIQEKPLNTFKNDPNYVSDSQGSQESQETQVSQESKESQSKSLTSQESKLSKDSELERKLATVQTRRKNKYSTNEVLQVLDLDDETPKESTSKNNENESGVKSFYKKTVHSKPKEGALDVVKRNKAIDAVKKITIAPKEKKEIGDYFPAIGKPYEPKKRRKLAEVIPGVVYTDPECMAVIKRRDKNANDDYVKEIHKEVAKELKVIAQKKKTDPDYVTEDKYVKRSSRLAAKNK